MTQDARPPTILCDIDGLLVYHEPPTISACLDHHAKGLPGLYDKLLEWDRRGCIIILLTGRREGARRETERQLAELGIIYDQLVMGLGGGVRVLINDMKPDGALAARCINVPRNEGIGGITF